MAWSYQRTKKAFPSVYYNLNKSGISTTIRPKGMGLVGGLEIYSNEMIPDTDLPQKTQLSLDSIKTTPSPYLEPSTGEPEDNIKSIDVLNITSQDANGIRQLILNVQKEKDNLHAGMKQMNVVIRKSKLKLFFTYLLLYGFIFPKIQKGVQQDITTQKAALKDLTQQLENCRVNLVIEFDSEISNQYQKVIDAFIKLANSNKIWDVTGQYDENRISTRSSVSTVIKRREVKFELKESYLINYLKDTLHLQNANGADLYIFPTFILIKRSSKEFGLIDLKELIFSANSVRFVETDPISKDTKVIGKTWAKVNKNGMPDRRFKNNYEIPLVQYHSLSFKTSSGLNEEFQVSNFENSEVFSKDFGNYLSTLKSLEEIKDKA
jgi:hypothetical protein